MSSAKKRVIEILQLLDGCYPLVPALNFTNPWQLLVAVMLSAQTTDEAVNKVTPALFLQYPLPVDMAKESEEEVAFLIKSVNYYKTKARHLVQTAKLISDQHANQVPQNMHELLLLPGVARKTANVVLIHAYDKLEGVVVDTHVIRLVHRLNISHEKQREKIEIQLMKIVPRAQWGNFSTLLVYHGRRVCKAQKPLCRECPLVIMCPKNL